MIKKTGSEKMRKSKQKMKKHFSLFNYSFKSYNSRQLKDIEPQNSRFSDLFHILKAFPVF